MKTPRDVILFNCNSAGLSAALDNGFPDGVLQDLKAVTSRCTPISKIFRLPLR